MYNTEFDKKIETIFCVFRVKELLTQYMKIHNDNTRNGLSYTKKSG